MPQDWFSQNAPKQDDWFSANAPKISSPAPAVEMKSSAELAYGKTREALSAFNPLLGPALDITAGAAKELGSTAHSIIRRIPLWRDLMPEEKPEFLKPQNTGENIGATAATAAEYIAPSLAFGGLPAVAGAPALGRAGVEALITGGVSKLRGETNERALTDTIVAGGLGATVPLLTKAAGPLGRRIELSLLKPLQRELGQVRSAPEEAGRTMIKNLYKWDLGGTLEQTYQKATGKLNQLGTQLRQTLGANPQATVDLDRVWFDTAQDLAKSGSKTFGTNKEIAGALKKMADEIDLVSARGQVNLADANDIKQGLGIIGSWTNMHPTPDSSAFEQVATKMYSKLREAIEIEAKKHGADIAALNRDMSEIIPIRNAAIRRIPVAQRREVLSLKEAFALARGDLHGMALAVADRGMRSGRVANQLVKIGRSAGLKPGRAAGVVGTGEGMLGE